ncbi:MAG: outer membrane beta-barrel protein [Saprospiraceae bacterium]|nr:outer membrane beta-barrel protein [Saprospiraceae bacterium]
MNASKIFALTLILAATTAALQAQPVRFSKGDLDLSAGIGMFSTFAADRGTTVVPPVSAQLVYRLAPNFSLGAYAAYSTTESNKVLRPNGAVDFYENQFTMLGLRAAAHSNRIDNWDIYGGFMVGYNIPNVTHTQLVAPTGGDSPRDDIQPTFTRPSSSKMSFSGFVGASYFFNKKIGAFGELGYGISLLNFGVTCRL